MKLKGYYIHYDSRVILGIAKKIDIQLKELRKVAEVEEINVPLKSRSVLKNALAILPYGSLDWDYSEAYNKIKNADFIYIRCICYDHKTMQFLKWLKKNNPCCKVISEIPTYPLSKETFSSIQGIVLFPKMLWNRMIAQKYIDRYVIYSKYDRVFGVETIQTRNGIDVDSVEIVEGNLDKNQITLIAVAYMQNYHGYDRLLRGLVEYYSGKWTKKVVIKMVGDGPELVEYRKIVDSNNLNEYVCFEGNKDGVELSQAYNNADIAVASLGGYRIGINLFSSLKTREYLAKGLPIVSGAPIDVFVNNPKEFYLEFPNDNTPLDIDRVVRFYDEVYGNNGKSQIADKIHMFAKENVDMSVVMKPILDYINA